MDKDMTKLNDISQLVIHSQSLNSAIGKIEIESIERAFPSFSKDDMIKMNNNGKTIKLPNMSRIFKIKLISKSSVEAAIRILKKENSVLFAEANMDAKLFSDVDYSKQWYLNNTGQSNGVADADIDAPEAWNIFTGSSSIKIGVIDSGVDFNHDDLSGKVSGDATAGDYHGTHVAGIAAAKANNTYGGRGVDWNAQIVSKRIFDGNGNYLGDVNAYNKIISAVNVGADVLNNSWGGTSNSSTLRMAFSYAYKMNRIATVAMGNSYTNGNPTTYPAAFGQGIIAVGATQDNDLRSPYSQTGNHIDVVAPGGINPYPNNDQHDIWSTWSNNNYRYLAGTSMATPIVSGIASLLKGYNTNLENDDIENIIRISADDKGASGWDVEYGTGRVNAKKALEYLRDPYTLEQKSATGGSAYNITGNYTTIFYGVSGLSDGVYIVKRYDVRKTVSLNSSLLDKKVWGRGVNTVGFSAANPNYGMGWCDVVLTSSSSATLRTYVYYVYNILGQPIGYFPSTPSNVKFEYTTLGYTLSAPSISMSGGYNANPTLTFSYNENVVDHFVLKKEYNFGSGWGSQYVNPATSPYTDQNVLITKFGGDVVARYSVKVVDALGNESNYSNTVSTNGQSLWKNTTNGNENETIKEYALETNYPNPFNPTTKISYQIPKDGFVSLIVYNTLGQKVAKLVDQQQVIGKYTVNFDAANLPSGLYIYKLQAGEFSFVKKMMLTK